MVLQNLNTCKQTKQTNKQKSSSISTYTVCKIKSGLSKYKTYAHKISKRKDAINSL